MLASSVPGSGTALPLSKLRGLCLLPTQDGGFPLDQVVLYLALSSIKTLSVTKLCLGVSYPESPPYPSSARTITSLELYLCEIDCQVLHGFLLVFSQLQSFAYSCGLPLVQTNSFDPSLILKALLAKAKDTLKHLTLFAGGHSTSSLLITSDFRTLEDIHLDWRLLFPQPYMYVTFPGNSISFSTLILT